jgi:hypothetical protein
MVSHFSPVDFLGSSSLDTMQIRGPAISARPTAVIFKSFFDPWHCTLSRNDCTCRLRTSTHWWNRHNKRPKIHLSKHIFPCKWNYSRRVFGKSLTQQIRLHRPKGMKEVEYNTTARVCHGPLHISLRSWDAHWHHADHLALRLVLHLHLHSAFSQAYTYWISKRR